MKKKSVIVKINTKGDKCKMTTAYVDQSNNVIKWFRFIMYEKYSFSTVSLPDGTENVPCHVKLNQNNY